MTDLDPALPAEATLVGRIWRPGLGASVATVRDGMVLDVTAAFPTVADLLREAEPARALAAADAEPVGALADVVAVSGWDQREAGLTHLLAPADLQPIKAAGVTFVASLLERVIEEQAGGDPARADAARREMTELIGSDLAAIRPGSAEANTLKSTLQARNLWSAYLEVGIGPDAEIFTKAPAMAAVGSGARIGVHRASSWNNPEPEVVLAIAADGRIVGATLGNDVNLRDVEGRSALLLGRAKDNNGACALGPFVRLFDDDYGLDQLRRTVVHLEVKGVDGFTMSGRSSMAAISRDPSDLAAQALNASHQYPDGVFLMCGTMFAPVDDRGEPGMGFTHHHGDVVVIAADDLGRLVNCVGRADEIPPWTYGLRDLFGDLARRGCA
ncbi:MAG: fumarylacetoacetate hydrolase family protein [Pseudomonadota bacterium]